LAAVERFMVLIEVADISSLAEYREGGHRSPTIADFISSKQDLYDAIGDLVIASQEVTLQDEEIGSPDVSSPPRSRKRPTTKGTKNVLKAGESLKDKVHGVCLNFSFLVEGDKIHRKKSIGSDIHFQNISESRGSVTSTVYVC
jgi:hypothetical protein